MARTSIREFRAALADHAHESRLMRAYRQLARTPRRVTGITDWPTWSGEPAATVEAGTLIDWPTWQGEAQEQTAAAAEARSFADWPIWNDGSAQQQTAAVAERRAFGDWSQWQQQPA
jgi:hypothetical protein